MQLLDSGRSSPRPIKIFNPRVVQQNCSSSLSISDLLQKSKQSENSNFPMFFGGIGNTIIETAEEINFTPTMMRALLQNEASDVEMI